MRTSLAIFLVLLQWLTPLMHAHTGQDSVDGKLHIPGLEKFILASQLSGDIGSVVSGINTQSPSEGVVFDVDEGLKQSVHFDLPDDSAFLPAQTIALPKQTGLPLLNPRAPPSCLAVDKHFSFSPRAPPLS